MTSGICPASLVTISGQLVAATAAAAREREYPAVLIGVRSGETDFHNNVTLLHSAKTPDYLGFVHAMQCHLGRWNSCNMLDVTQILLLN